MAATVGNLPLEYQSMEELDPPTAKQLAVVMIHHPLAQHLQDPATQVMAVNLGLLFNSLPLDMEVNPANSKEEETFQVAEQVTESQK